MKSIEFKNITFGYKKNELIFNNISFKVTKPSDKGFIVGLMGNSGSGKSTILKLILGIEKQYEGNILIYPENPVISYVPQEPVLFEHLSLMENAEYFKRVNNYRVHFDQEQFDKLADILQVKNILYSSKSINEISGGQKQRISLLRALSIQPDILLLDEPLTGLDEEVKDVFLQTIATLVDSLNLLIIYITHHKKEVEFISNEILYLTREYGSQVVGEVSLSKTDSFFNNPPTLSALNAIKDVSTNVVQVRQTDNRITLYNENRLNAADECYYMVFKEGVVCFRNDYGYEYEILHNTGIYSLVRFIESGAVICVRNEKIINSRYICLNGSVKIYNGKGIFVTNTEVNNDNLLYI